MLAMFIFLCALGGSLFLQRTFLFGLNPVAACQSLYAVNPFPAALEFANYIRDHTSPEARIAVLGSEPEVYFYAHRHSATGYIYTYALMEKRDFALVMQREMIREVADASPQFIVFADAHNSWFTQPDSNTAILDWAEEYARQHYDLVGRADIFQDHTVYYWDEAAHSQAHSPVALRLYRRSGT